MSHANLASLGLVLSGLRHLSMGLMFNAMYMRIKTCIGLYALASLVCAMAISACASSNYPAPATQNSAPAEFRSAADTSSAVQSSSTGGEDESSAALEALWRERTASTARSNSGFTLGPGDVLRISVPMISQLTDCTVRVSEDDTIALPLLGVISVAGMTEQDLRQELASRLGRYMYNPQVEVFLQTPENRVVSVLGTVKAPGRYLVTSRSDTILTLLSRAGGSTESAGSQILLFPAPSVAAGAASAASLHPVTLADASTGPARYRLARQDAMASVDDSSLPSIESGILTENRRGSPLVISMVGPERYLDMPVRAGDVLYVPAAGSVSVQGWVDKPGIFPITPGMTALGSIAAAGGALYTSSATLVRTEQGGGHQQIALNLPRIKSGQEPDVRVRGGDVIIVERSAVGALPYTLYFLVNKIGLGLPLFY